ncbi:RimJ/RimL family protein N-acetyltransferase [Kribbella aluminosa]|uniref:RimJ/RimL family protein N-acetyltransferase n=1 Tax=Kribbella aluminosa TaxID=416017 RepID=A0ABS4UMI5_9ACTN|nr:GNAT family protein [Kribbella aluminosa]MBP2352861.1 RimJ/RimL family protein N-acetyltransferase [Kribbella aluminosa]
MHYPLTDERRDAVLDGLADVWGHRPDVVGAQQIGHEWAPVTRLLFDRDEPVIVKTRRVDGEGHGGPAYLRREAAGLRTAEASPLDRRHLSPAALVPCLQPVRFLVMLSYPLLDVRVGTPVLELRAATDELLDQLAPVVHAGKMHAEPTPYDDPISFFETDPDLRVAKWLRSMWRGRGNIDAVKWRLYFVVVVDGEPVGMQDVIGVNFSTFGTVTSFSWLSVDHRGRGLGKEMRQAILHLAFEGLGAKEASSDAFVDNLGSNAISRSLGYAPDGFDWATRRGEPALLNRWRLNRQTWEQHRRSDIELHNVDACHALLPLS